jgi:hypothetical protein
MGKQRKDLFVSSSVVWLLRAVTRDAKQNPNTERTIYVICTYLKNGTVKEEVPYNLSFRLCN